MVRVSNIFGAFFGLLFAVGITYTTATPLYGFISSMTGDAQVLSLAMTSMLYVFIIVGMPIMMGIEDETKVE